MKKLIVLTVLLLMVSLAPVLMAPFLEVRALVADPHFAPGAILQAQTPRPIRTLPSLEEIRVWLGPNIVDYTFGPNHIALTTRYAVLDFSNFDMRPLLPEGQAQIYDVFYSNADGILNIDGSYLTIEVVSYSQAQGAGGGNVAEVGLRSFGSTTFEYGNTVASFVTVGTNANPNSIANAIDGNRQTYSTLGNTAGDPRRLRITIGFLSSSGTPPSALSSVSIEDTGVAEGNAGTVNAVFRVRLSDPGPVPVTVAYSTHDSTAHAPDDYTATSGTLTFPANSGNTLMTITIPVKGDAIYEAGERFFVDLSGPINTLIGRGRAAGTITDDDMECSYSISPMSFFIDRLGTIGSSITPEVTASEGCSWRVTEDMDWIVTFGSNTGTGRGSFSYAIGENTSAWRAGPIHISGQVRPGEDPFVPVGVHMVYQDGPDCPFELICAFFPGRDCFSISPSVARSFRDDALAKSPLGKVYTDLYYKFSSEAVQLMMFNPMLMLRSRELIERYKPVIQSMVEGEQVTLTRGDLDKIDGFLNSFAAKGSPQLQQAVREVCEDLKNPSVHDEFHITIIEGPEDEMPAHHLSRTTKRAGSMASLLGFCLAFVLCIAHSRKTDLKAKGSRSLCVVLVMLLIGGQWSVARAQSRATALPSSVLQINKAARSPLGELPLTFEANQGQVDSEAKFLSRANKYSLLLKPAEAVMAFESKNEKGKRQKSEQLKLTAEHRQPTTDVLRMKLVGADPSARMSGLDEAPGKTNYFVGKDSTRWRANVPNYARLKCEQVYPGIDMLYYGNQRELEYDFIVAPGADPRTINLQFDGADKLETDRQGDLVLDVAGGQLRQRKPVAYQETDGIRREVACRYNLINEGVSIRNPQSAIRNCLVGFELGAYDTTRPLIIDPLLTYSTYLGGGGNDEGNAITVDSAGNIYVVGFTGSINFPTASPSQPTLGGGQQDVFVTKLNPSGTQLIYSTYLGGNGQDNGSSIAVDSAGNAYITGFTGSTNFPMRNALQPAKNGLFNAFIAKLDPTGSLLYSTHLGGSVGDYGSSITVDSSGNVYLAGVATSANFPMVNALQPSHGGAADLYVAKLDPSGSQLVYSTYLGGAGNDGASGIAVDSAGNVYLTGVTSSQNFRTASPLQASHGGGLFDAFVAKVNPSGNQLVYSTYLGGGGEDRAFRIAVDSAGNAYVTGDTDSSNFPTANALQRSIGGSVDAFVSKINASGSALVYSTYLGGSALDGGTAIAVDSAGSAYAAGFTGSANFPTIEPVQQANGGGSFDAFVAKLSSSGAALEWSTYLGGSGIDAAFGIAVDSTGNAYLMGQTESTDFPTASPLQPANGGGASDLFIARIVPTPGAGPRITGASVSGKKLFVMGSGFDTGARILINDEPQKTNNDDQNPGAALIAKKSGKKIARGRTVMLRVRNSDGTLSNQFSFTR